MNSVIQIESVSKRYQIGKNKVMHPTLRDALTAALRAPIRAFQRNGNSATATIWALRDINAEIKAGETVGLIGANGAGKSTLLKILSRVTQPTTGRVRVWGRMSCLLEVGTGFHPELTGRENIYLNGAILGMTRKEIIARFDEIVAFSGVEKFIDTPVKRYSSGMYLRLAFAVAAHLEPEILIVDEVLAVGDAAFQKKCIGKMSDVAGTGRTVIFVSHNMEAVRKLCARAILLENGQAAVDGKVEDVIDKYVNARGDTQSIYTIPPPSSEADPGYAYKLSVEDGDCEPAQAILVGLPWQIRVSFTIKRRTENFIIGIGFRTITDVALRTSWSESRDIEPGEYEAVFREEVLWLTPGRYPMVVGLSTNGRKFHYAEAGTLEIAEVSDGLDLVSISGAGLVVNPLKVKIERVG